ncbi:MAG TPA: fibronectin type III domain-containing protein, partial [Verrucomicrobiae bacterium]|nr:fibronectin type III domain-containing protein [Verrucomicrobiae bacterium]
MQNATFGNSTGSHGLYCLLGTVLVATSCLMSNVEGATPGRPFGLTLTAKNASSISLAWTASTGEVATVAFEVYRDGKLVGTSVSNSFVSAGLLSGQAYTFRVRARDVAGGVSEESNALLATPQAAGLESPPALVRTQFYALVLNYDPWIYVDGAYVRAADHYGFRDVGPLLTQYTELLRKASGGQMNWKIVQRFDLNEWAPPDGQPWPLFDATNCVELVDQGYEYRASYTGILHDPRFNIIPQANQEKLDAVWVFGPPGVGFWETSMAGPNPFWINGGETFDPALTRNIVFYGFGKAGHQGVGFMCENTCHMTECIVRDRIAPSWPLTSRTPAFNTLNLDNPSRALVSKPVNDWTHLTQAEGISWDPTLVAPGSAQAGLSHFPPTALFNYDWNTLFLDFNSLGPLTAYDGVWASENGELHVWPGDGVKTLALDGMSLSDETGSYHPAEAFSDGDIEFTLRSTNGSASSHAGFLFRVSACAAGANQVRGYYLGMNASEHRLVLAKLNNAFSVLTNVAYPFQPGRTYRFRLELRGARMLAYVDDALDPALSMEESSYANGGFGFAAYDTEAFFDNLSIITHIASTSDQWYRYPNGS